MRKSLLSALFAATVLALAAATSQAADVAFVDVVKVANDCTSGKSAQKILDDMKAQLEAELKKYAETEKDVQKVQQRQMELNRRFQIEQARVSNLVVQRIRAVAERWLQRNRKNYSALLPIDRALAVDSSADVTDEILRLMNRELIDFKAPGQ